MLDWLPVFPTRHGTLATDTVKYVDAIRMGT
jgi:hypothetical protein